MGSGNVCLLLEGPHTLRNLNRRDKGLGSQSSFSGISQESLYSELRLLGA